MEFPWSRGRETGEASTSGAPDPAGNIMLDLDERTLQCLVASEAPNLGLPEAPAAVASSSGGPSSSGRDKRKLEDLAFTSWLSDKFGEEEEEADDSDQVDESGQRIGRKGKPMTSAAVAKASREKARRERLNECFEELACLCDPTGRGVKTDRVSVVADAIRVLTQLRVENNQLRQLNKFLEERVAGLERARAQSLFQQTLLQQQQQQGALSASVGMPPGLGVVSPQLGAASERSATPAAQLSVQMGGAGAGRPLLVPSDAVSGMSMSGVPPASPQVGYHTFVPVPMSASLEYGAVYGALAGQHSVLSPVALKTEQLGALTGVGLTTRLEETVTVTEGADAAQAGALAWLPAPNATEDGKLRPPAA